MSVSCTRCGTSLSAQGDTHDCDGMVVRDAYEVHVRGLGRDAPIPLVGVAAHAEVPYATVVNWVKTTPGLELSDDWIIVTKVPTAESPPATANMEGINGMFLLIRIEELSRELGRRDVEVALLQAEIQKLRGPT